MWYGWVLIALLLGGCGACSGEDNNFDGTENEYGPPAAPEKSAAVTPAKQKMLENDDREESDRPQQNY